MTVAAPVYVNPTGPGFKQFLSTDTISIPGSIALPSFTAGSVLFAGVAGAIAQDNASLFWDDANNRLGIGVAVPLAKLHVVQAVVATGTRAGIVYVGAVCTNQTLSTEIPAVEINTAGREWATGAIAIQREFRVTEPTYSFVGASTITDAATFGIRGAPIASTNCTITATHGLLINTVNVDPGAGAVTASYGLTVNAMSGAVANHAAQFIGGAVLNTSHDFEALTVGAGYICKSPDGTRWRITVDNAGAASVPLLPPRPQYRVSRWLTRQIATTSHCVAGRVS
jgi:hypothetical protein